MLLIAKYIEARERSERTQEVIRELLEKERERSEHTIPFVEPRIWDEVLRGTRDTSSPHSAARDGLPVVYNPSAPDQSGAHLGEDGTLWINGGRSTEPTAPIRRTPRSNTRLEDVTVADRPVLLPEHLQINRMGIEADLVQVAGTTYWINPYTGEIICRQDGLTTGNVRMLSRTEPGEIPQEVIEASFLATRYQPGNARGQMHDYSYMLDEGDEDDEASTSND